MPRTQIDLLRAEMEEAYLPLLGRLDALTDEELWWEPVPDVWTLRRQPGGRLLEDYEDQDADPAPFTTLAWRLFHVSSCKVMYHEWAFGPARLTWQTIERPDRLPPGPIFAGVHFVTLTKAVPSSPPATSSSFTCPMPFT